MDPMGLETVELVMEIEDEVGIQIPDEEAQIVYDLGMDARPEIVKALRKRRKSRPFDDVI